MSSANVFPSVQLLDETAILACAAYVDLNPIRAAMAETIETSSKTLICIFDNDNCRFEFVSPVHAETHSPLVPGEFVKEEFLLAVNFMYRITLSGKKS